MREREREVSWCRGGWREDPEAWMENRRAGRLYVASVRRAVCCTRRGRAISAFRAKVYTARHTDGRRETTVHSCICALRCARGVRVMRGDVCSVLCPGRCGVGVDANNLSLST